MLETSADGSAAAPFTDNDFRAGDVLVHSTSPGGGAPVFIDWTAPSAGTITLSGEVRYAHSTVTRSNDYSLTPSAGQSFGSLAGVDLTVNLTPSGTPEPGTTLLLAGGLLGMAVAVKLRRPASART